MREMVPTAKSFWVSCESCQNPTAEYSDGDWEAARAVGLGLHVEGARDEHRNRDSFRGFR